MFLLSSHGKETLPYSAAKAVCLAMHLARNRLSPKLVNQPRKLTYSFFCDVDEYYVWDPTVLGSPSSSTLRLLSPPHLPPLVNAAQSISGVVRVRVFAPGAPICSFRYNDLLYEANHARFLPSSSRPPHAPF